MQTYIGVKRIQAEPEERDGKPGYKVVYPGGYESWSPKDVFEKAYFPMDSARITMEDIERFCEVSEFGFAQTSDKHRLGIKYFETPTGFALADATSPIPKNREQWEAEERFYHETVATIWKCLDFVRCWADNGLKK